LLRHLILLLWSAETDKAIRLFERGISDQKCASILYPIWLEWTERRE